MKQARSFVLQLSVYSLLVSLIFLLFIGILQLFIPVESLVIILHKIRFLYYPTIILLMFSWLYLWVFMLIHSIRFDFNSKINKVGWIVILLLTHFLGGIVYYFFIYKKSS